MQSAVFSDRRNYPRPGTLSSVQLPKRDGGTKLMVLQLTVAAERVWSALRAYSPKASGRSSNNCSRAMYQEEVGPIDSPGLGLAPRCLACCMLRTVQSQT